MPLRTLGSRLKYCPKCGEELFESPPETDDDDKVLYWARECANCDLLFKKKRGPWYRWKMGTFEDHLEDELTRI